MLVASCEAAGCDARMPWENQLVNANDAPAFPPGTLAFLFEHVRGVPDLQIGNGDALDGKAAQLFAAGSVVLGLSATSGSLNAYLLVAALGAYVFVVGGSFWCLWSRKWRVLQHVDVLWSRLEHDP